MILKELLERSEYTLVQGSEDVEISTLVYDSRKIEKGSVFVCISGAVSDGHTYIEQVAEKGAAAVIVEKDVEAPEGLTVIKVKDTRYALAMTSAAYFGYPAEKLRSPAPAAYPGGAGNASPTVRPLPPRAPPRAGRAGGGSPAARTRWHRAGNRDRRTTRNRANGFPGATSSGSGGHYR